MDEAGMIDVGAREADPARTRRSTSLRVVILPKLTIRHLAKHKARQDAERLVPG